MPAKQNDNSKDHYFKRFLKHPLFVAFMGALFGALMAGWSLKNTPPIAKIIPENIKVNATENITFDAQGSSDPDGGSLTFEWRISGHDYDKATIASCDKNEQVPMISCRFATPGTHIVSVTAIDDKQSKSIASSSVKVELPGGYIGFVLQFGNDKRDMNFLRAFNYAVDWPAVQTLLRGIPIVLYEPDEKLPVFAMDIKHSFDKAKKYADLSSHKHGIKIIAPISSKVEEKIALDLSKVGISVTFSRLPGGEVFLALERGLSNSGFVPLSSIDDLAEYY